MSALSERPAPPQLTHAISGLTVLQQGSRAVQKYGPVDFNDPSDDDDPMPIPSTWRNCAVDDPDCNGFMSDALRAGLLGYGLGLIVILPLVIIASGQPGIGPVNARSNYEFATGLGAVDTATANVATASVGQRAAAPQFTGASSVGLPEPALVIEGLARGAGHPVGEQSGLAEQSRAPASADIITDNAKSLIAVGDINGARRLLESSRTKPTPDMLFVLAETYDPNMLAAWGEVTIQPDIERARGIYMLALLAGAERAKLRLDGLPPK